MDHLLLSLSYVYLRKKKYSRNERKRQVWVLEWLLKRNEKGCTNNLLKEFNMQMPILFTNFLRMSRENFDVLLGLVSPIIQKQDTVMRESISASDRLMVTLRYLAVGDSFKSLSFMFRISTPSLTNIIPDTCEAIYRVLKDGYLKVRK